ncbi:MAG: hypothetical protein AAGF46_07780 [Pseudomonadota bacterium]
MNKTSVALAMLASCVLAAANAEAQCTYPSRIDIPNGSTATKEEMLAARDTVKQYMATMNEYLDCLEAETAAAAAPDEDPAVTTERKALMAKKYNAAVEQLHTVAESFNVELRTYKARDSE